MEKLLNTVWSAHAFRVNLFVFFNPLSHYVLEIVSRQVNDLADSLGRKIHRAEDDVLCHSSFYIVAF